MAATVAHKRALQQLIRSAQSPSEMLPLLNEVNFIDLQEFAVNQIKDMSSQKACSTYYRRVSITDILPDDLQQHTLTFLNVNRNRTVCQSWNRLNQQNEENTIRAACSSAKSRSPSQIWILRKDRKTLNSVEERFGCKGPLGSLLSVKSICPPRSLVLVHQGSYGCDFCYNMRSSGGDISFVGIAESAILLHSEKFTQPGSVLFENLTMNISGAVFGISDGAKVVFKNCCIEFQLEVDIVVEESGSLELTDCRVICKGPYVSHTGIQISPHARNVIVEKSEFRGFAQCASICHDRVFRERSGQMVEIKICQNVFHGMTGHAVVEMEDLSSKELIFGTQRCILSGNINGNTGSGTNRKLNTLDLHPYSAPTPSPAPPSTSVANTASTTNTTFPGSSFTFNDGSVYSSAR